MFAYSPRPLLSTDCFGSLIYAHRYQSLHYTASLMISGEEWSFEVQVRLYLSVNALLTRVNATSTFMVLAKNAYRYALRKCIVSPNSVWPPTGIINFRIRRQFVYLTNLYPMGIPQCLRFALKSNQWTSIMPQ